MVDVKRRIEKISKAREGRSKLVSAMLGESDGEDTEEVKPAEKVESNKETSNKAEPLPTKSKAPEVRDIAEMDKRVGELEKLVGSSSTSLDEVRTLLPPH